MSTHVLNGIDDASLQVLAVWVPVSGGREVDVAEAKKTIDDPRVQNFWDGSEATMARYKKVLQTPYEAWDVYLVYDKGARWTGELPPMPGYWMHQLRGDTREGQPFERGVFFDGKVLAEQVRTRLATH